jgi:4-hydroxy-tetrahydrodipicolinate reductase
MAKICRGCYIYWMMKIGLIGADGRMGKAVLSVSKGFAVIPIKRGSEIEKALSDSDVVLDFSTREAALVNLPKILRAKKPYVIGITALSDDLREAISQASKEIPIFLSANFSEGIDLLKKIIRLLPEGSYELSETHHVMKKDSPSGTALDLAERLPSYPQISSSREGDVVGLHKITLHLEFERLEFTHEALDRKAFAKGALLACRFLSNKPAGLYTEMV